MGVVTHGALLTSAVAILVCQVQGNGRMLEPPSRASMWRAGFLTTPNFNDNRVNCGGNKVLHEINGGKCGVCGDPWNGPREHEPGGLFATGAITRKYRTNDTIFVVIELTKNNLGWFEFRLCESDDAMEEKTHECLNKHLLEDVLGDSRFDVPFPEYVNSKLLQFSLVIPEGVRCRACMLQWKYHAGNSWGVGPDGVGCVGCGDQDQYHACADIAIGYDDVELGKTDRPVVNIWTTTSPPTTTPECDCEC
ncbi:uncharacterized protein LOC131935161 [Physella acuta]|uniref:uncharacterized protein LOC131935161 n=1 Tax=Physella acuta TaxID=109671 RepID=UPI0027DC90C8|nr:uncharacterized protein LOC131935161 [Physella acuta]